MIWNAIFNFFFGLVDRIAAEVIPDFTFEVPDKALLGLFTLRKNVGYILPIPELVTLFNMWIAFQILRINIAIKRRGGKAVNFIK